MTNLDVNALLSIAKTQLSHSSGRSAMFEFGAVTTVDINSQKIFEDVAFSWSRRLVVPSSAVGGGIANIVINPTTVPDSKTIVILPVSFTAVGAGPIFGDLYVGTDSDEDGTEWLGQNRDGRSSTTPDTTVRFNPSINDIGVKSSEFMIPSNGVSAVASFGGQAKDDLILIARNDIKYTFQLINQEANTANASFALTIFEASL